MLFYCVSRTRFIRGLPFFSFFLVAVVLLVGSYAAVSGRAKIFVDSATRANYSNITTYKGIWLVMLAVCMCVNVMYLYACVIVFHCVCAIVCVSVIWQKVKVT